MIPVEDIQVSVEINYQEELSEPKAKFFVFVYKVFIENNSTKMVQLISRHWNIFDSNGMHAVVHDDSLSDKKPVLNPGEHHEYLSYCTLKTDSGTMVGEYVLIDAETQLPFSITVPEIELCANVTLS